MQRHRFFAAASNVEEGRITLDADESHHLTRVLRLSEGDDVFVLNGEGREWECEIIKAGKNSVELTIRRELLNTVESPLDLTLAQALIKGDKFDLVVQKSVEMGVTRIVPLITEHCEIRRAEEKIEHRLQRWRRIAMESVKQCGRRKLPEITDPLRFDKFCEVAGEHKLIFNEKGGRTLREISAQLNKANGQVNGQVNGLTLCVAPEGGWSEAEIEMAEANKFLFVHLGPRILRTETAAIAAVAISQHLFGDIP